MFIMYNVYLLMLKINLKLLLYNSLKHQYVFRLVLDRLRKILLKYLLISSRKEIRLKERKLVILVIFNNIYSCVIIKHMYRPRHSDW